MVTDTQVKTGYKQTDIGLLPNDWKVDELGQYVQIHSGESPSKFSISNEGIPYFKVDQLNNSTKYQHETPYHIDTTKKIPAGSIIFPKRGAAIQLNKVRILKQDSFMDTNLMTLTTDEDLYNEYVYYVLSYINLWNVADTTSVPQINNKHINPLLIQIPKDVDEQKAIAQALGDLDEAIQKLDQLIEKKRNIKQGTMQELLTGRRRLPGFSGEWEQHELPNVCWFQEGPGVRNTQFTSSGVKLLNGTNIFRGKIYLENTDRFISENEAYGPYSHFLADSGDIVIASSGVSIEKFEEKIAFVENEHLPLCMNTSTIRFKANDKYLVPKYLYYYLMTPMFKEQIGAQATGSAQLNFGPAHLKKIVLEIPGTDEQKNISRIIGDLDKEIEILDNQKNKYLDIKQGMMQQLLTGRIRLI